MRIWVFSDIHLEFGKPFNVTPPSDIDVIVCAGDVMDKGVVPSIEWLSAFAGPDVPVIFVNGNHEFYRSFLVESIADGNALRDRYPNIHFLDDRDVVVDDVLFSGATLWTDFRLFGRNPEVAMWAAEKGMNDYRRINLSKKPFRKFKPIHAYRRHDASVKFLSESLGRTDVRKRVVVTHHAPSDRSISRFFRDTRWHRATLPISMSSSGKPSLTSGSMGMCISVSTIRSASRGSSVIHVVIPERQRASIRIWWLKSDWARVPSVTEWARRWR